ncbi:MAG: zinc ABC transporter substrate-binding protein [Fuerstia sp.]|nr:zinc ABC transporter substrate-binding protein [Fuerstiella sp.]
MRNMLTKLDDINRRRFVEYAAKSALGVSVLPLFNGVLNAAQEKTLSRVDEIDAAYTRTLAKATDRTIVVAHDAYTLLATRYELTTVAIAGLNASEPTMKDIRQAIDAVKSQGAKVVFVEPQLSRSAGDKVAQATGVKVLVLDPVGGDDWFVTMSKNLDSLAKGLGITRE